MPDFDDVHAVQQLIARFANSFDRKAWDELSGCLAPDVFTDYSDLRGTPPETLTREQFVELRRIALAGLRTHHLAGNVEIALEGDRAEAKVSMLIQRRAPDGEFFDTHCLYTLGLGRDGRRWSIRSIVQEVFWSDGQPAIHRGAAKT